MKVKELIAKLQECDQELEVMVNGYEGGCEELSSIDEIEIMRNRNVGCSSSGKHEELSEWMKECKQDFINNGGIISKAVIIR